MTSVRDAFIQKMTDDNEVDFRTTVTSGNEDDIGVLVNDSSSLFANLDGNFKPLIIQAMVELGTLDFESQPQNGAWDALETLWLSLDEDTHRFIC